MIKVGRIGTRGHIIPITFGLAVLAGYLYFIDRVGGYSQNGVYPTRIVAVFVDSQTGQPLEGVSVWAVSKRRLDRVGTAPWWRYSRATATTKADGAVDARLDVRWGEFVGYFAQLGTPPPYYGVAGLVVEKDGYRRHVVDCTTRRWTRHERVGYTLHAIGYRDLHATLEIGEVSLARAE